MSSLADLPTYPPKGRGARVVIESPAHTADKVAYDPELGAFVHDRPLPAGLVYPHAWGFVPGTRGDDGDPLDAMVIGGFVGFPGCVVVCIPVAVARVVQRETARGKLVTNDRIVAYPESYAELAAKTLGARRKRELATFFETVGRQAHDVVRVTGWGGPAAADAVIRRACTPRP